MNDLVIDSGVIVKWFVLEDHATEARRILADYENRQVALLAPDLIYAEFGNVIWKKQVFQGLRPARAEAIIKRFRRLQFKLTTTDALLEDAYHLAVTHRRAVYDMLYLALSLCAGCQFVTADEKLVNAVGATFSNIIWLANWP